MKAQDYSGAKCGRRYEQDYINKFRDCLTFYYDGNIRFERFCYGEGACFVFGAWATMAEDGTLTYKQPLEALVDASALPQKLTGTDGDALVFDERRFQWRPIKELAHDSKHGYSQLKMLFAKLFHRS